MTISNLYSRIRKPLWYSSFVLVLACAGDFDDSFMTFFQPETSVKGYSLYDYHFSPSFLYGTGGGYENFFSDSVKFAEDDNLRSWLEYIGGNYTIQEVGQAIYRSNKTSFWNYDTTQTGISTVFLNEIKKHDAVWKYLQFAWEVEASQTKQAGWNDESGAKDSAELMRLLPEALKLASSEKDPFIKERYEFQAIKINGELRNMDEEIKLYNEFFANSGSRSPILYWAESRMAGAFLLKGDTAQAVYHFAQVFENCSSKRSAAYMSLRLNEVRFVPQALNYCKNGKEKAAVYALCAIQPWQESTGILSAMLTADPTDSLMRLVFTRELNKAEYDKYYTGSIFGLEYTDSARTSRQKGSGTSIQKLQDFAALAATNTSVPDRTFWLAAEAHTSFLLGNYSGSNELLQQAEKKGTKDSLLEDQIILQKFLLFSELTTEMTSEKEDELIPMLDRFSDHSSMQHSNAFGYAAERIGKLYKHKMQPILKGGFSGCNTPSESGGSLEFPEAKAFIFELLAKGHYMNTNSSETHLTREGYAGYDDLDLIRYDTPSKTVESVIQYFQISHPRDFDKRLQKLSYITTNPLYRLLGTRALIEHKYDIAREAFSHIDTSIWVDEPYKTYLAANPFWTGVTDTHAPVDADSIRYTPLAYAKKMSELAEKVNHDGSGEDCFELACGVYNMTGWGNSWLLIQSEWSGSFEMNDEFYWYDARYKADTTYYTLITEAEKYFTEAANRSTDKEFKAKAYFMAAKCEQKRFYYYMREKHIERSRIEHKTYFDDSRQFDSLLYLDQKKLYRQYFNRLLTDYADTKFSEEAKTECAFYDRYAKGK